MAKAKPRIREISSRKEVTNLPIYPLFAIQKGTHHVISKPPAEHGIVDVTGPADVNVDTSTGTVSWVSKATAAAPTNVTIQHPPPAGAAPQNHPLPAGSVVVLSPNGTVTIVFP